MPATDLDPIDLQLLALLQHDASRSNLALAEAVGVSPATALRRVRRLVDEGVIERQVALLSPAAVGVPLAALAELEIPAYPADALPPELAAIPAVIFYNKFSADITRIGARLENFADEFSAIISRQLDERV